MVVLMDIGKAKNSIDCQFEKAIYSDIALFLEEEKKVSGFPDGEVGAQSVQFSEKVLESSSKGTWVKVKED